MLSCAIRIPTPPIAHRICLKIKRIVEDFLGFFERVELALLEILISGIWGVAWRWIVSGGGSGGLGSLVDLSGFELIGEDAARHFDKYIFVILLAHMMTDKNLAALVIVDISIHPIAKHHPFGKPRPPTGIR